MRAGIALLGVLALLVGVLATTATAKSDAGNTATAAKKKKCKKKKHSNKASEAKKKKKCKKKKNPGADGPGTVRATLRWNFPQANDGGDLDLYVWDNTAIGSTTGGYIFDHASNGNGGTKTGIGNSRANIDNTNGSGPEFFTDLDTQSTRRFTYGVCLPRLSPTSALLGTPFTLTVRFGDGTTVVRTQTDFGVVDFKDKGDFGLVSDPGGSFAPPGTWCPT